MDNASYILVTSHKDGSGDIRIQDLTVKTPGEKGKTLVENVNLTFKKGDRIILTGESGSGKTTFAKALLNQWDYGSGLILQPENIKIIPIAQQAYFPDTTLRGIMNRTPDDQCTFADRELTEVLQKVGLDKLIQHIPGQQIEILMDDLLEEIPEIVSPSNDDNDIHSQILSRIAPLVEKQFDTVQYTPQKQRDYFQGRLIEILGGTWPQDKIDELSNAALDEIDNGLAHLLYSHLAKAIPDIASRKRGKVFYHSKKKNKYLAQEFNNKMQKGLKAFINNKDTDDIDREVKIHGAQAVYVAEALSKDMCDELHSHDKSALNNFFEGHIKKSLGKVFHTVSMPLRKMFRVAAWPLNASHMNTPAEDLVKDATFFMARQVVTGKEFSNSGRLSGGQKQKLLVAIGLLHNADLYVLDEITASMDKKGGEKIYREMMRDIQDDAIVLSIAHNEHIIKHHTHHARLENKTITVNKVVPDLPEMKL